MMNPKLVKVIMGALAVILVVAMVLPMVLSAL